MQIRTLTRLLPLMAILFMLASCSKTNKQGKLIPANASIVVHMNGKSLSGKLPWEEIKGNVLFQKLYADSTVPAFVKNILNDPDNSGIDIKSDLLFFVQKDSLGTLVGFEGNIKDAAKFKAFNLEVTKHGAGNPGTESEKDGISYISRAPLCVGWNKDRFVYVFDAPHFNFSPGRFPGSPAGMTGDKSARDIGVACKNIFDLKEKNSLGSNEKFTALMKKDGDIHFWMNSQEMNKELTAMPGMAMMNLEKLFEGSVTAATANFENGKITIDYKAYAGKLLDDILKKYSGGNINEDMLKRIPSKDVAAVLAMNFKPEGIKELLKAMGMDGLANLGLAQLGFNLDDFIKANKGDILIAVTDFRSKTDSISFPGGDGKDRVITNNSTTPDVLFSASIGDKEAFNKLIAAGNKILGPKPGDSLGMTMMTLPGIAYSTSADYFAIGNSKTAVDSYIAGTSKNNFDFISKLSGNPFGGYVNLQYIMKAMETSMTKDSSAKIAYDASLKMWDNVYMSGGKYNDGGVSYSMEVNLLDKSTNSLKQLNQYLGKLGYLADERKKKDEASGRMEDFMIDTAVSITPAPQNK
ncbi:MAG TPA: DUF4836 family protein [Ferruginibacter sp.]|nr:DUF4836 family protein [Ferruginibacter sp.]